MRIISKIGIQQLGFLFSIFFIAALTANPLGATTNQTDLIIYSYDRPMQLYALLESIEKYVTGLATISVIYRTSNHAFEEAYKEVQIHFTNAHFFKQSPPYDDLKTLTCACFAQAKSPYILFGVDDIIVKDFINLNECIDALEESHAHGFFFRLGKNLDFCYAMNCSQPLPLLKNVRPCIYSWHFNEGLYDWHYPHNLDFTLYSKSDFENLIESLDYKTPYSLESQLMGHVEYSRIGLCYESSKIVNFPLRAYLKTKFS